MWRSERLLLSSGSSAARPSRSWVQYRNPKIPSKTKRNRAPLRIFLPLNHLGHTPPSRLIGVKTVPADQSSMYIAPPLDECKKKLAVSRFGSYGAVFNYTIIDPLRPYT